MIGMAGVQLTTGVITKMSANKSANEQRFKANEEAKRLKLLEANRQEIIDKSADIRRMKGQVNNPYANLQVATKAADLQIEQTDLALANTLDTIQRGGMAKGGTATALAQAAAQAKAKMGATIENQEAQNAKLRAQGEASAQAQKMQLEQMAIGEEVASWGRREGREMQRLNRTAALQRNAEMQAAADRQGGTAALMAGIGGAATTLASADLSKLKKGGTGGMDAKLGDVTDPSGEGMWGYGEAPDGTKMHLPGVAGQEMSMAPDNINQPSAITNVTKTNIGPQGATPAGYDRAGNPTYGGEAYDLASTTTGIGLMPAMGDLGPLASPELDLYQTAQGTFGNPQGNTQWEKVGLTGMIDERKRLQRAGKSTDYIQSLINATRSHYNI